jgi:hypothetical protein
LSEAGRKWLGLAEVSHTSGSHLLELLFLSSIVPGQYCLSPRGSELESGLASSTHRRRQWPHQPPTTSSAARAAVLQVPLSHGGRCLRTRNTPPTSCEATRAHLPARRVRAPSGSLLRSFRHQELRRSHHHGQATVAAHMPAASSLLLVFSGLRARTSPQPGIPPTLLSPC